MLFLIRTKILFKNIESILCKQKLYRILLLLRKWALPAKLYKHTIQIVGFLLITLFSYFYLNYCLQKYQNKIEYKALQDIQQAFIKYIKENSSWQIIEIIRNKNKQLINESEYIYDLDSNADKMFSRYIYYELNVNNISLITNTYSDQEPLELKYNFNLSQDINCSLGISKNPNAQYFKDITLELNKVKNITTIIFSALILYILFLLVNSIKNTRIFIKKDKSLIQLLKYLQTKKKNTALFHNYYIKKQYKLFSVPLLMDNQHKNEIEEEIDLQSLEYEIMQYVKGYGISIENNINLRVDVEDIYKIQIYPDKEIFRQIIFSTICNILHFLKNSKDATITVLFKKSSVEFSYDKSFPINEDILKVNSDPVIINEFFEPFILGFGSIFDMLNKLGFIYKIKQKNNINIIEIIFVDRAKSIIPKPLGNVVDITKVIIKKNEI